MFHYTRIVPPLECHEWSAGDAYEAFPRAHLWPSTRLDNWTNHKFRFLSLRYDPTGIRTQPASICGARYKRSSGLESVLVFHFRAEYVRLKHKTVNWESFQSKCFYEQLSQPTWVCKAHEIDAKSELYREAW